jgi:hypothetical protein
MGPSLRLFFIIHMLSHNVMLRVYLGVKKSRYTTMYTNLTIKNNRLFENPF